MIYHDAIVVGGGLAGLRAAIELNRHNIKVAIISKVHPVRSHSVAAQGGINAALGNHPRGVYDTWEKHAFDTVKGSDYLADQNAVIRMTKEAAERIYEMEHWGCPFSRTIEGKIAQRPFGGAGFPRACYASDTTGQALLHTLYQQIIKYKQEAEREEMVMYQEWLVTDLVIEDGVCVGVIAWDIVSGRLEVLQAGAVIFATGGVGRIYGCSTNALINTGMGMAVPYWAGAPLKDMEFIQFHPTTLLGKNILITEGCRGEGGFLLNNKGERFLAKYSDSVNAMEIAPRDILSRNIIREIMAGSGIDNSYVHLDLRHLGEEKIQQRLPGIRKICREFTGMDPVTDLIPIQPGQHYTMGGIDCTIECETSIKGLYAAGEAACVSVHGANRLGGNSLLDTIVFGAIAGKNAVHYLQDLKGRKCETALKDTLKRTEQRFNALCKPEGNEIPADIKVALNKVMDSKVGIFRNASALQEALYEVKALSDRYNRITLHYTGKRVNLSLAWALELKGSLDVAEAVIASALAREESRGSHFRTDFPKRDDTGWLKHTVAHFTPEGVKLDYKPVNIGPFEPKERKY
ncbi:MAG: FAD-binding protein [Candidatus Jettenia sp.]|uniref:succinate dehydrogenase n=1 Tax=Candidatus Jettenia caeni TaxID=247490 RepID=I3INZ1_9BACT|nr:FAD-dependent oxidoreductase [Candidatus Jettenia sp. AMX1]MBC6927584.1 FAD-binding protein [Candidatus Jettenia sp.]NUN23555.1 FAD-binding protein [Candidatus Jettenia caeni]KAA0251560.1 MAG: FAD-binding protein [Candidatus Jettenia sp. AMX1]MCQ3926018.1 FAD-binding protein [Candidatus Jettenia sp.]MDL1937733.1 FAD-binding protein [Candidatus Jettenia sp. AMX1]